MQIQTFSRKKSAEIFNFSGLLVRVVRLERTVSWSQTRRDTSFAIPGYLLLGVPRFLLSVVIAVVKCNFEMLFTRWKKPSSPCVPRAFGVLVLSASDTGTALPNQARYQLRYTPIFSSAYVSHQFPKPSAM